jgi:hypothetical protein
MREIRPKEDNRVYNAIRLRTQDGNPGLCLGLDFLREAVASGLELTSTRRRGRRGNRLAIFL